MVTSTASVSSKFDESLEPGAHKYLDLRMSFESPENIVLSYTLAGPVARGAAFVFDSLLRTLVISLPASVLFCTALFEGIMTAANGLLLILYFVMSWLYFGLFEALWNGRTPGKALFGLRVLSERGYPITLWGALGRNLVRTVDAMGFYLVGFIVLMVSGRFQRLGDLLCHTVVVHETRRQMPRSPLILDTIDPLPDDDVRGSAPTQETLALIDYFLDRRRSISVARGHEVARPLAVALLNLLDYQGDRQFATTYAMAFLARVHVTYLRQGNRDSTQPLASNIAAYPPSVFVSDVVE